jgi:hypothetical protein
VKSFAIGAVATEDPREAQLHDPHVLPLMNVVRDLRAQGLIVPNVDPNDGGVNARVLVLLETPGPKAVASGFVSRDNPDPTARNLGLVLDEAGLFGKATLHEISRVMGLLGKPKGFDGGEVERYFREGKIREIADYCEADVVSTYQVWLRYELFRGTLSQNAFDASQRNLADFMNARSKTDGCSE